MQQPERYNMSMQPLHMTVSSQPRGSNEQINKLNYYDVEVSLTTISLRMTIKTNQITVRANTDELGHLPTTQLRQSAKR